MICGDTDAAASGRSFNVDKLMTSSAGSSRCRRSAFTIRSGDLSTRKLGEPSPTLLRSVRRIPPSLARAYIESGPQIRKARENFCGSNLLQRDETPRAAARSLEKRGDSVTNGKQNRSPLLRHRDDYRFLCPLHLLERFEARRTHFKHRLVDNAVPTIDRFSFVSDHRHGRRPRHTGALEISDCRPTKVMGDALDSSELTSISPRLVETVDPHAVAPAEEPWNNGLCPPLNLRYVFALAF